MENQKQWYQKSLSETLSHVDAQNGLSEQEVLANREQFGANILEEGEKRSLLKLFLAQFQNSMIIILIVAAVISFFLDERADAMIILAIVGLNAVLGVLQEDKAEKALAALKAMAAPMSKVRRDGQEKVIPSETWFNTIS